MIKYLKQFSINNIGYILLLLLFIYPVILDAQYDIPKRPASDASLVFNYSKRNVISSTEQEALNQKLIAYEGRTSTQIALIIIDSLNNEDINYLGTKWLAKWKIGQADKDNGMVILMSVGDRRISIQNGYGLEEYMTDAKSRRVIDNFIIPYFKQGQFYQGFNNGLDAIFSILDGKFVEDGDDYRDPEIGFQTLLLIALGLFVLYLIFRNRGGGGGGIRRRRSPFGSIIFTDFGRSTWSGRSGGFGGGGFGGGGFGGFGGGMGGGGGASGSW